jgi:hypothetical protein
VRHSFRARREVATALASVAVLLARASVAHEEPDEIVRSIVGLGPGWSDGGRGWTAQFGIGVIPFMLRASLDVGGTRGQSFVLIAARADWSFEVADGIAAFAGLGIGILGYGLRGVEDPSYGTAALLPELGAIVGPRRTLGRILFGVTFMVPTSTPFTSLIDRIAPPTVIAAIVFSL